MRTGERIPLHNHADRNSGGLVSQSTIVTLVNGPPTAPGTPGGASQAVDVSIADAGGYFAGANVEAALAELGQAPSGAPGDADYLVGTASGGLSAEIVVGTTPGGELGGTWASPTVDATHSGSAHLALGTTSTTAAVGDHTHIGGSSSPGQSYSVKLSRASLSVADNTEVAVSFTTEDIDTGGMHSTSVNPSRVTIGTDQAGTYLVGGQASFALPSDIEIVSVYIEVNGSKVAVAYSSPAYDADHPAAAIGCHTLIALAEGDIVELVVAQSNTAAAAINADSLQLWVTSYGVVALDDLTDVNAPSPSNGDVLTWDSTPGEWIAVAPGGGAYAIVAVFDGGTVAITGNPEVDVRVPAAGTLTGWAMLADAAGDAVIDVWKDTFANFPPTNADAMPGSGKEPTLSSAAAAEDTNIADWSSVTISAGDVLRFHLDSSSTVKRLALTLTYTRS